MTNCILIKDRNLYKLTWQKAALHYWTKIFLEILLLIFEQWTISTVYLEFYFRYFSCVVQGYDIFLAEHCCVL